MNETIDTTKYKSDQLYDEILDWIEKANLRRIIHRQRAWKGTEIEALRLQSEMLKATADLSKLFAIKVTNTIKNSPEFNLSLQLTSIEDLGGDAHFAAFPLKINWVNKKSLIYKPRRAWSERSLTEILIMLGKTLGLNWSQLSVWESDSGSLWEVIPYGKPMSSSQISHYFYATGVLLATAYALRLSDLNHENIIASNKFPIVVDAEFICQPSMTLLYPPKLRDARGNFERTVLETLMLPLTTKFSEPSALGLATGSHCANGRWLLSKHLPVNKNGRRCEARDYLIEIIDGFKDAYLKLTAYKKEIIQIITKSAELIRISVRPTRFYVLLEKWLWSSPIVLTKPNEVRKKLQEKLLSSLELENSKVAGNIAKSELEALLRGDIPIFFAKKDSNIIYNDKLQALGEAFPNTPLESLKTRLFSMKEADMMRQIKIIQQSLISNMADKEMRSTAELTFPS